jgi:hypothetical protein
MVVSSLVIPDRYPIACVIDPALALSRHGVALVKCLGCVMELWVARELWHILNDTTFYITQPQLIAPRGMVRERTVEQEYCVLEETILALKEWEKFRLETDLNGLNFFWIGDSLRESYFPSNRNLNLFGHWESVFKKIDIKLRQSRIKDYILPSSFQDTIALAITLESATILTYRTSIEYENNLPPEICTILGQWGISCVNLPYQDSIVELERSYFYDLLVRSNGAKFFLSDIHLSILHLLIPTSCLELQHHKWSETKGFWYAI